MQHESIAGVEVLGGSRWAPAELAQIAAGSTEAPLEISGESVGRVVNVRAVGGRLLADLRGVPARVAALIRAGRFTQIGAQVFTDLRRGLRTVVLGGGELGRLVMEPAGGRSYDEGTAAAVKRYVFELGDAGCAEGQEEGEMGTFEQTDAAQTADIDAEVMTRVRQFQQEDPSLTFEAGFHQMRHRDPDLWQRYGKKTCATLMTSVDDPAEQRAAADWREAGREILREADRYQQRSQALSRADAIRAVLRNDEDLARRYLRGNSLPGM